MLLKKVSLHVDDIPWALFSTMIHITIYYIVLDFHWTIKNIFKRFLELKASMLYVFCLSKVYILETSKDIVF